MVATTNRVLLLLKILSTPPLFYLAFTDVVFASFFGRDEKDVNKYESLRVETFDVGERT